MNSYHDDEQKRFLLKLLHARAPLNERVILFDSLLREQAQARKEMRMAKRAMGSRRRKNIARKMKALEFTVKREMRIWGDDR